MAKKFQEPNNGLQELKQDLKTVQPARLYVFYGEESFLLQHYLQQLRKKIIEELTASFNDHRFTAETFDMQAFTDAVENLPMMAERTLVQVDDIDLFKLGEGDREHMIRLLSDIPDYCTVVFVYNTVEYKPDKRQKKLWEAISKHGTQVEFARQNQRELIAWVGRHFAAAGKRISNELCAYLIDITGGLMTTLSGEIDTICAFSGSEEIVRQDIDAVTEPVLDAVVFQMTDFLAAGKYAEALLKLQQLLKMQQEPIAILGAVGSQIRRIGAARTVLDCGKSSGELMKLCGMGDYPARKTMDAARRFTPAFCAKASQLVLETDYAMKTSYDEPERLLELLILQLAQEARRD